MSYRIERAHRRDSAELYALELRCFDPGMALHSRQIKDLLLNPRADVWALRNESHIVGQIIVLRRKFADGIHARIYSLTVDPAYRGQGFSKQLVLHCLNELQHQAIRNIYLEVESSALVPIQLYKSLGFTLHHELPDYYDIGRHGIKM